MDTDERDDADSGDSPWNGSDQRQDAIVEDEPETPEEGADESDEEDVPIEIEPLDTPIEKGSVDPENALFVVLGMVLTILVVVRFLSVLP